MLVAKLLLFHYLKCWEVVGNIVKQYGPKLSKLIVASVSVTVRCCCFTAIVVTHNNCVCSANIGVETLNVAWIFKPAGTLHVYEYVPSILLQISTEVPSQTVSLFTSTVGFFVCNFYNCRWHIVRPLL